MHRQLNSGLRSGIYGHAFARVDAGAPDKLPHHGASLVRPIVNGLYLELDLAAPDLREPGP